MDNTIAFTEISDIRKENTEYQKLIMKNENKINELMLPIAKEKLVGNAYSDDEYVYVINDVMKIQHTERSLRYEAQCITEIYGLGNVDSFDIKYISPSFKRFYINELCEMQDGLREILNFVPFTNRYTGEVLPVKCDKDGTPITQWCRVTFTTPDGIVIEGEVIGFDKSTRQFTVRFGSDGKPLSLSNSCSEIGNYWQMKGKELKVIKNN